MLVEVIDQVALTLVRGFASTSAQLSSLEISVLVHF